MIPQPSGIQIAKKNWPNSGQKQEQKSQQWGGSQKWVVKPSITNAKCCNIPVLLGLQSKQTSISASFAWHSKMVKYFQPLIVHIFSWQPRVGWVLDWIGCFGWYLERIMSWERPAAKIPVLFDSLLALDLSIFAHSAKCCNCFDHCAHFLYYSTIKLMTPKTRVFKWKLAEAPPAAKQIKVNYLPHCCRRDHYYYFLLNRCESCLANCCGSSFVATLHVGQKEVKLDILECWIAPG